MFPPRRVLAAVDFSDCSRIALNAAGRLTRHCGAELVVLHVLDPLLAEAARTAGTHLASETARELDRFVHAALGPHDSVRRLVVTGKASDAICDLAERENADVIVIGAHGMSGVAHALFGSTTERVLRESSTSVFVVPATWTAPEPCGDTLAGAGPVIVGMDLTCASAAAAGAASQLARLLRTRLEVLHVVPLPAAPAPWRPHAERAALAARTQATSQLQAFVKGLRPDVHTTVRVESGDVAGTLARAATSQGELKPLLVLGRSDARPRGAAPGAIAYRVLTQSAAPVLVYLPMD